MKVICKNNVDHSLFDEDEYEFTILLNIIRKYQGGKDHLIIGKAYEVVTSDIDVKSGIEYYLIENETGIPYYYSSTRFMTLDEYRESKLNDIGII
jgi:hypothetical protein